MNENFQCLSRSHMFMLVKMVLKSFKNKQMCVTVQVY